MMINLLCAIKDTFKEEAEKHGHEVDIVDFIKKTLIQFFEEIY